MTYAPPVMTPYATIRCPECGGAANFAFATWQIIKKEDVKFFERSKDFEVFKGQHSHGSYFRAALYYPGLNNNLENIHNLPEGYKASQWRHRYWYSTPPKEKYNAGTIRCTECLVQKKHQLNWPADAYFQIDHKGQTLWAYDRKFALKLLKYIESNDRDKTVYWHPHGQPDKLYPADDWFLRKIPEHFQTAKARPAIVKKLKKLLGV